jgi:hypothetical protein
VPAFAAKPATSLHPSPCMVEQANWSPATRNNGDRLRSSYGVPGRSNSAAITEDFSSQDADENFGPTGVSRPYPGSCPVTLRAFPAPGGTALFCFRYAALRVTVSTFVDPP